jgi:hypothetical protein
VAGDEAGQIADRAHRPLVDVLDVDVNVQGKLEFEQQLQRAGRSHAQLRHQPRVRGDRGYVPIEHARQQFADAIENPLPGDGGGKRHIIHRRPFLVPRGR